MFTCCRRDGCRGSGSREGGVDGWWRVRWRAEWILLCLRMLTFLWCGRGGAPAVQRDPSVYCEGSDTCRCKMTQARMEANEGRYLDEDDRGRLVICSNPRCGHHFGDHPAGVQGACLSHVLFVAPRGAHSPRSRSSPPTLCLLPQRIFSRVRANRIRLHVLVSGLPLACARELVLCPLTT